MSTIKKIPPAFPIARRVDLIVWFSDQCVHQLNCVFACTWVCVSVRVCVRVFVRARVCVCLQEIYSECKGISWPIDFSISCTAAGNKKFTSVSSFMFQRRCCACELHGARLAMSIYLCPLSQLYIPSVSTRAR